MKSRRFLRKFACLAAFTTGTCWAFGIQCIQDVLASLGITFF